MTTLTLAAPMRATMPAPTPLPSLTWRDRVRMLGLTLGERETTVWVLLGMIALLVLATASILTMLVMAPEAMLGPQGLANAGSARVLQAFVGLVLWLSLMGLFGAAWCTGSFDRMLRSRAAQAVCICAVVTAAVWLGGSVTAVLPMVSVS